LVLCQLHQRFLLNDSAFLQLLSMHNDVNAGDLCQHFVRQLGNSIIEVCHAHIQSDLPDGRVKSKYVG